MAIINIIVNIVLLACIFINIFSARKYRKKLRALNDDFELLRDFERQLIEDAREVIKAQEALLMKQRKAKSDTADIIFKVELNFGDEPEKDVIRAEDGTIIVDLRETSNEEEN